MVSSLLTKSCACGADESVSGSEMVCVASTLSVVLVPVKPSEAFKHFRHDLDFGQASDPDLEGYRTDLLDALSAAKRAGIRPKNIVTASVFTTQSATAVMEKIRDQIHAATPEPADFFLGPGGERTVFDLDDITGITWGQQTRVDSPLSPFSLSTELTALRDLIPGAVSRIAYGKYTSPEYLVHPGEFIPPTATGTGAPQVQSTAEVYFNVVLPSGPAPAGGWPVAIYGTGAEGTKDTWLLRVGASMAAQGIATVSINFYGRGFGPQSTIAVQRASEGPVTFLAGGRSIDQNGDGAFAGGIEGFASLSPIIAIRDSYRQTVIDWSSRPYDPGRSGWMELAVDLTLAHLPSGNSTGGNMGTLRAIGPASRVSAIAADRWWNSVAWSGGLRE